MITIDQSRGECFVFTYKEGLLSPVAHDLRLRAERWSLAWDPSAGSIDGRFDAASLVVDVVMREGQPAPGVLDAKDRAKIAKTIRDDVLASARYPEIRFRATLPAGPAAGQSAGALAGELTMHGATRKLSVTLKQDGASWVAEARLHQPDWGVKPYSAMFGTLKVKPEVQVRVSVPSAALDNG